MCLNCTGTRLGVSTSNQTKSTVKKTYATRSVGTASTSTGFGKPAVRISFGKRK